VRARRRGRDKLSVEKDAVSEDGAEGDGPKNAALRSF
jgi:hypothetical protein